MNTISFPGLGISPFKVDPTAIKIGGFGIQWYAIIITFGMILAFLYAKNRAKYEGITGDDIYDVTIWCILFGIIGARLYYVIFKIDEYIVTEGTFWQNVKDTLLGIINIRNGGLAIYGGIIVGVLVGYFISKKKHIRFPVLADVAAPAIMIGQILGRWGNFFNAEAFGGETSLPWRMGLMNANGDWIHVHPTFLYESLWNLVGFVLIAIFYKKKKYNGQVFLFYVSWYGLGRAFIEGLRTDSLYLGPLRVSQILGLAAFAVGTVLFFYFMKKTPEIMKLVPASVAEPSEVEAVEDTGSSKDDEDSEANEDMTENTTETESENKDGETD
ncbi:MAG: prolipoprotein diacylglyceryl transferase [Ruminococcaceae bacterium]|nr:prolipoprotein diacylglyceryl transferase [Oscillospiraceae bacterium]